MSVSRSDQVRLTAWSALDGLTGEMDELADQISAITAYARRWVCQRAGFEPSPLCLMRPLAELMDVLADAFAGLERVAHDDVADLRLGLAQTGRELRAADEEAAARLPVVA